MDHRKRPELFLDVCILLPQAISHYQKSCEQFLQNCSETLHISSSVNKTIVEMINTGYDWVVREIQEKIQTYLGEQGINKLTNRSCRIFERFFKIRRRMLASINSPSMHYEILGQIEVWTAAFIHSIKLGQKIDVGIFLTYLISAVSHVCESLKAPSETAKLYEINYEEKIKRFVFTQGVTKPEDIEHLSSAIQYQFENNVWIIFVTFDNKDILSNQEQLVSICGLHCCKPIYALDYLRELSGFAPPLEYYRKIKTKTSIQKAFEQTVGGLKHI